MSTAWAFEAAQSLIREARFDDAERVALDGLDEAPEDEQANRRYAAAVAQRYGGRPAAALATLDQLIEASPLYARAYQEKGHVLLGRNEVEDARAAYAEAVRRNGALLASWKALANIAALRQDARAAAAAGQRVKELEALAPPLLTAASYIEEGKYLKADDVCRAYLRQHPHQVDGMRLLARVGERMNILPDAEFLLETARELHPESKLVRYDYVNLLLKMQKFAAAHREARALVELDPTNLSYRALLANAAAGVGDNGAALDLYAGILSERPEQNRLRVMQGHTLKTIGRLDDAVDAYAEAARREDAYGDAWWSLANTKTYRFGTQEIERMMVAEAAEGASREDRIHLAFAIGKALEDAGDHAKSFEYYDRGNALKREELGAPDYVARTDAQIETCSAALFDQRGAGGHRERGPIFILGMPRAGSTLLEQILASHPHVDGTHELPNVIALAQRLQRGTREQGGYPAALTHIDTALFERFGAQYIEETRVFRAGAPLFIDKNPNNYFHVGLIRLILPEARVIDARRHPLACCFSGFKQLFGQGQEFSYGLERIGTYYREYVRLMAHWEAVLPGFVLRVDHEDVVDDLESQVRRMLDFCGLAFDPACLAFHETERAVRTPSSEQVRQPIYRSALDTWRDYEPWLGPLKSALGESLLAEYQIAGDAHG